MSLETRLREQLQRHTDEVEGGPDLATAIRLGRSRRRRRSLAGVGGGLVATAAVVSLAVVLPRVGDDTPGGPSGQLPASTSATSAITSAPPSAVTSPVPAPTTATSGGGGQVDFVPGTDRDERLAAAIADHVPGLPSPDDVYPSDVDTAGPLPDSAAPRATDFQATYTLGPDDRLLVFTGYSPPGTDLGERGVVTSQVSTSEGDDYHLVGFVRDDGFTTSAMEIVPSGGRTTLDPAGLRALVQDRSLHFPAPADVAVQH